MSGTIEEYLHQLQMQLTHLSYILTTFIRMAGNYSRHALGNDAVSELSPNGFQFLTSQSSSEKWMCSSREWTPISLLHSFTSAERWQYLWSVVQMFPGYFYLLSHFKFERLLAVKKAIMLTTTGHKTLMGHLGGWCSDNSYLEIFLFTCNKGLLVFLFFLKQCIYGKAGGSVFTTAAQTAVLHHVQNPDFNDEVIC